MSGLTRTRAIFEEGVAAGRHAGAQAVAFLGGEPVADEAFGSATRDGVMLWMSAGKPVTAVAVLAEVDAGRLGLDDEVASHLPGFERNGKAGTTIRHLLTHTSGFRAAVLDHPRTPWAEAVEAVNAARQEPRWSPGERAGYHVYTSWYTLGALLETASGLGVIEATEARALGPLGMRDCHCGMTPAAWAALHDAGRLVATLDTTQNPPADPGYAAEAWCTNPKPGANNRGPAAGLVRLYRMLLDEADPAGTLDGVRVLEPATAAAVSSRQREGLEDATFKATIDWGLGVAIDSKRHGRELVPYGFGPHASDGAFGHGGNQCAVGFADPAHGLAAAVVWDGMPGELAHQQRLHTTLAALYEDLGLA
ncbi:serine hydrolase domain-containing protein [Phycisphaera mikurensis]|uniref:Putative esterase n=1 Tax=Phycisphaera mikurensis (strain NBRC 102666 / KCTC 22515 / FYK2301M01) TaxID=1142394 RepID=I0IHT6_PHYMF|nr:serine hydrolase domain-containing protein [Phycisphaera mikurensis]MBB6441067.1 CubicO group peptidase (beta-lactamase class C family) [Phycisphaera mikurensis]BAM04824.1 putative esterase [Phycisphaera mikurensis NBRC 102666]